MYVDRYIVLIVCMRIFFYAMVITMMVLVVYASYVVESDRPLSRTLLVVDLALFISTIILWALWKRVLPGVEKKRQESLAIMSGDIASLEDGLFTPNTASVTL
jgi:Na+/melibiose symporter-like transporter